MLTLLNMRFKNSSGNPAMDAIVIAFIAPCSPSIMGSVCTFMALSPSRSFKSFVRPQPAVKKAKVNAATIEFVLMAVTLAPPRIAAAIPRPQQTFANKPSLNLIGGMEYIIPKTEKSTTQRKTVKLTVRAIAALATKSTVVRTLASRIVTRPEGIGLPRSLIASIFAS